MKTIDLNCDLGESYGRFQIGNDAEVMPFLSSCNVACGFHGGDPATIEKTLEHALAHKLRVGAHPSFPDLGGFGRRFMAIPEADLAASLRYQIVALAGLLRAKGGKLAYVKPHGALYNAAARQSAEARAVVAALTGLRQLDEYALMGPPDSELERQARAADIPYLREGFIDRRYEADGRLRSREFPDAVISDTEQIVEQGLRIAREGSVTTVGGKQIRLEVDSLCVHGDHLITLDVLPRLRAAFDRYGIEVGAG